MNESSLDVYFSLGSNLGDRIGYLKYGIARLKDSAELIAVSPVYETEAWGYTDSRAYLNIVAHYRTELAPEKIMSLIDHIQSEAGRPSRPPHLVKTYEPRTLDIDILFYGNKVFNNSGLNIPHPRLHLRNFVLIPFADIAPEFVHPVIGRSIDELKQESRDTLKIHCVAQRL